MAIRKVFLYTRCQNQWLDNRVLPLDVPQEDGRTFLQQHFKDLIGFIITGVFLYHDFVVVVVFCIENTGDITGLMASVYVDGKLYSTTGDGNWMSTLWTKNSTETIPIRKNAYEFDKIVNCTSDNKNIWRSRSSEVALNFLLNDKMEPIWKKNCLAGAEVRVFALAIDPEKTASEANTLWTRDEEWFKVPTTTRGYLPTVVTSIIEIDELVPVSITTTAASLAGLTSAFTFALCYYSYRYRNYQKNAQQYWSAGPKTVDPPLSPTGAVLPSFAFHPATISTTELISSKREN